MHIQRLFEIVYLLLYQKRMTAKELAQRFEVSTRTIYRDIDTLSAAGIPIYTNKGKDGGIFLMEHYVLNRSLLNDAEQKEILSALHGIQQLQPVSNDATLTRLRTFFAQEETNWMDVDLSDWSNRKQSLFQSMKEAIQTHHIITFTYYSSNGTKSIRSVQPIQLYFKDHTWYLRGICLEKQEMRTFKISRIKSLQVTKEVFTPIPISKDTHLKSSSIVEMTTLTLHIHKQMAYRVYDEFEESEITKQKDGSFVIRVSYPLDQWVYGNLLSYGSTLQVIEPSFIREELKRQIKEMSAVYE